MKNININIDKAVLKNIDIDKGILQNIDIVFEIGKAILKSIDLDININKEIMENIDINKDILENMDIDKILNQPEFGISNRANRGAISSSMMVFLILIFCKIRNTDIRIAIFKNGYIDINIFQIVLICSSLCPTKAHRKNCECCPVSLLIVR